MTSGIELVITRDARLDIEDIFRYTAETWGIEQADAYDRMLHETLQSLRRFPEMGREVEPGVREHVMDHHIAVYEWRPEVSRVAILRIVNHRQRRRG